LSVRPDAIPDPIRAGFRDLGYSEGQNFVFVVRSGKGSYDNESLMAAAAELVAEKVDVILTRDGRSAVAAKQVTTAISIVFATSGDALRQGLVESLSRPEANATGFTNASPETSGKRIEILQKAFPGISQVAAVSCPPGAVSEQQSRETEEAAKKLGITIVPTPIRSTDELDRAMQTALERGAQAAVVFDCSAFPDRLPQIALELKLPGIYPYERYVRAGGLMYYGPDEDEHYYRSASYVHRILNGTEPSKLPVQQPTKFRLVINAKAARAMGVTIAPVVLQLADEVIE
jgi:putative ABC transport system substrate-binding protein